MRSLITGIKGITTISLLILLIISALVGAVLSYLWTVGYFVEKGFRIPEGVTNIAITNVVFPPRDSTYFNITVLHPSYSETDLANIAGISIIADTEYGERIENILGDLIEPMISTTYPLRRNNEVTFKCNMNWGEYAGQDIRVAVFLEDGSGATTSYQTDSVTLDLSSFSYNTSITVDQFNITLRNVSDIPLDISNIRLGTNNIPEVNISVASQPITLPHQIQENETIIITCHWTLWNAKAEFGVLGTLGTIQIETLQGYQATHSEIFTNPVKLAISNVTFLQSNMTQFILANEEESPHFVEVSHVTIDVGNETIFVDSNASNYRLDQGINVTILCDNFNWEDRLGQQITIRVFTTQGFLAKTVETIPLS